MSDLYTHAHKHEHNTHLQNTHKSISKMYTKAQDKSNALTSAVLYFFSGSKPHMRAREMAQRLRVIVTLIEDLIQFPASREGSS